jgi:hypothetical protein
VPNTTYTGEFVVGAVSLAALIVLLVTVLLMAALDDLRVRRFVENCDRLGGHVREVKAEVLCVGGKEQVLP